MVGTYSTPGTAIGVAVLGNYAYVADDGAGLQIIDISNPSSPSLTGTYDTSGNAFGVAVLGDYAYVADYGAGLQIIDISNPSSPSLVGACDTSGHAYDVEILGNYAYVADGYSGVQIIDISNPSSPSLVGTYDTSGYVRGVAVLDNYVYVADTSAGLQVIDVSTPSSPNLIGAYGGLQASGVAALGNYAYIADGSSGLKIIEGAGEGIRLVGTPSSSVDAGLLELKVTASDGVDEVSTTFSIDVQNETPTVSDVSKTGAEDTEITFSAADFTSHFDDVDEDSLTKIQITSLPVNGALKLSGSDVTLNQEINVGDLNNLTFDPDNNWYGNTVFAWKGSDGTEYSVSSANVNIQINGTQDAPTVSDVSKMGTEDTLLRLKQFDV